MTLVHWALICACSGNVMSSSVGIDIIKHGDRTRCGGHGWQACLGFLHHVESCLLTGTFGVSHWSGLCPVSSLLALACSS
jgi:hypothetical protein